MVISRLKKPEHSSTLHMLVRLVLGLIEITSINLADIVIENGFPRGKGRKLVQTIIKVIANVYLRACVIV